MNREEAIADLITLKEFFEERSNATPVCLEYAITELERLPESSSDCISRRAALEAIKYSELGCEYEAIMEIPPAQPEHRWIPCSERLPDEDSFYNTHGYNKSSKYVMVTVLLNEARFGFSKIIRIGRYDYKRKSWVVLSCPQWYKITAWMPLPEPYAERREDEC